MPKPVAGAWSEYWANTGPSEITPPTPAKPMTIPIVIDRTSGCSPRNRYPSRASCTADRKLSLATVAVRTRVIWFGRRSSPHTMRAEKKNVNASSHSGTNCGWTWKYLTPCPIATETPARAV